MGQRPGAGRRALRPGEPAGRSASPIRRCRPGASRSICRIRWARWPPSPARCACERHARAIPPPPRPCWASTPGGAARLADHPNRQTTANPRSWHRPPPEPGSQCCYDFLCHFSSNIANIAYQDRYDHAPIPPAPAPRPHPAENRRLHQRHRVQGPDTFAVTDPATGLELAQVANLTPTHTQQAIDAAEAALPAWRSLSAQAAQPNCCANGST